MSVYAMLPFSYKWSMGRTQSSFVTSIFVWCGLFVFSKKEFRCSSLEKFYPQRKMEDESEETTQKTQMLTRGQTEDANKMQRFLLPEDD